MTLARARAVLFIDRRDRLSRNAPDSSLGGRMLLFLRRGLVVLFFGACSPIDVLGFENDVIDKDSSSPPVDPLADDRIEDKHPMHDPSITIDETFGRCTATLNKSGSVTKLDIVPFSDADADVSGKLFHGYLDAARALGERPILPSMEVVDASLKPFNDGLYAAIELGAEDGSDGATVNKRAMLLDLFAELVTRSASGTATERPLAHEAAATLGAALRLGGATPVVPVELSMDVDSVAAAFSADAASSVPVGFYTWQPALQAIFQQDRLLQAPVSARPTFGAFASLAVAIKGRADLPPRYQGVLDLYAGLTNPYFHRPVTDLVPLVKDASSLGDLGGINQSFAAMHPEVTLPTPDCAAHLALFPPSDSPETKLFRRLFCDQGLPRGNVIDVLIAQIRSGALDLTPTANSGWYDRQVWALETLLVPDKAVEKDHLFLTKRYKEKLVETFKTLITERRETHVKQLEVGGSVSTSAEATPVPFDVYPLLPVEPFPTFYLRTARGYAFLENLLPAMVGAPFLSSVGRVREDGTRSAMHLGEELHAIACRVYGLHVVAARSIGMKHQLSDDEAKLYPPDACEAAARAWLQTWQSDEDVARDPRVIVPVERDDDTGTTRYWAVIGAKVVRAEASFYPGFEPQVTAGSPPSGGFEYCMFRSFVATQPYLLSGVQVEIAIRTAAPPLTRDAFRALCDAHHTTEEVVAALGAL